MSKKDKLLDQAKRLRKATKSRVKAITPEKTFGQVCCDLILENTHTNKEILSRLKKLFPKCRGTENMSHISWYRSKINHGEAKRWVGNSKTPRKPYKAIK